MRKTMSAAVALVALCLVWAALAAGKETRMVSVGQKPDAAVASAVKIDNFSFGPGTLTVVAGTTVTWTNRDDIPHTVVSTKGVFKSKVLDTDETFSFTFGAAGSYPYFCSIHPKMTGTIEVK
jgi:plastocyanin